MDGVSQRYAGFLLFYIGRGFPFWLRWIAGVGDSATTMRCLQELLESGGRKVFSLLAWVLEDLLEKCWRGSFFSRHWVLSRCSF